MLSTRCFAILLVMAGGLLYLSGPVAADDVVLKNGLVVSGKVTETGDKVRVERPGGVVTYSRDDVKEIKKAKTTEEIYREKKKALKKNDAEGHLALADWCSDNAMPKKEEELIESILEFAPDNVKARDRLGYVRNDEGKWVLAEQYYRSKGYVKYRGRWMKPEDRAKLVEAEREAAEEEAKAVARAERAKRKKYSRRSSEPREYWYVGGYNYRQRYRHLYPYYYGYPYRRYPYRGYPRYGRPRSVGHPYVHLYPFFYGGSLRVKIIHHRNSR